MEVNYVRKKIIEIANKHGYTGWTRVKFFVIAPFYLTKGILGGLKEELTNLY